MHLVVVKHGYVTADATTNSLPQTNQFPERWYGLDMLQRCALAAGLDSLVPTAPVTPLLPFARHMRVASSFMEWHPFIDIRSKHSGNFVCIRNLDFGRSKLSMAPIGTQWLVGDVGAVPPLLSTIPEDDGTFPSLHA